mmetsp:Transcript_35162/g.101250  ORF Transcript_35162/g.101250 Transcript_35162/m.101250 type:complete len:231 (-) Transcript_35162:2592-3284(-)
MMHQVVQHCFDFIIGLLYPPGAVPTRKLDRVSESVGRILWRFGLDDVSDVAPIAAVDLEDRIRVVLALRMEGADAGRFGEGRDGGHEGADTQFLLHLSGQREAVEYLPGKRPRRAPALAATGAAWGGAWKERRRRPGKRNNAEPILRKLLRDATDHLVVLVPIDADLSQHEMQVHATRALEGVKGRAHLHMPDVPRMSLALRANARELFRQLLENAGLALAALLCTKELR